MEINEPDGLIYLWQRIEPRRQETGDKRQEVGDIEIEDGG
jgi:hypothetical protein